MWTSSGHFLGKISTQLRQSKAVKTGERRQTGESYHCTLPDHPPAPPHPSEEFDLTRWDGKHCVTPARGTAKQSTIWFNAYIWTNLFSALFKISTFKIIMCCVDERAGGFALEEGTREDIVKEERKRTKLKRLSRGVWVGDWVRWLKRRYTW